MEETAKRKGIETMGKRGSKKGVKRGPYTKRKPRRYPTHHKTNTPQGKKEYQRLYMKPYMRKRLGISPSRFGVRGRKPKAVHLKEFGSDLKKLDRRFRGGKQK